MFVDRVRLQIRGGAGGAGVGSFKRQKGKPRGKPDGGSGGRGGDVVLVAEPNVPTLLQFWRRPHWAAGDGTHGEGDLRHGKNGDDLELLVPLGTIVYDTEGVMVADLVEPGRRLTIAEGGRGGRGNAAFVTTARRAPTFAEQGEYGDELTITLELKLIADAALIGFPNAGKSTLVAAVSAARPKIADYPFTTLEPNLGVVDLGDRQFVLADIPGLIEGAASGKGLGHEFLRHTERARVLVMLLDPTSLQETSVAEQHEILQREIALHSKELAARPTLVVVNKIETVADTTDIEHWATESELDVHLISAVTGAGVDRLLRVIADTVDLAERAAPEREGFVLHRPLPASFSITRSGDEWVVSGRSAHRAVNLADLTVPEAADFAASRLNQLGVDEALGAAGAQPGDDVRIGDIVFTYDPDSTDEAEGEDEDEDS